MPDEPQNELAQSEIVRFLGVDSSHFEDFLRQVEEIKLGIQAVNTNTQQSDDSLSKLVAFYTEQKGMSPTPSRAVAADATPQVYGRSENASDQPEAATAPTTGGPSKPPNILKALQAMAFGGGGAGYLHKYGTEGMAGTGGARPLYENDDSADEVEDVLGHHSSGGSPSGASTPPGGAGTGGIGASSGASGGSQATAQNFLDVVGPMSVPRAGEFTVQNAVEQMARYTAQQAVNADPSDPAEADKYLGYTSFLNRAATQWVPTASMVSQYGSHIQQYGQQAVNYGESVRGSPVGGSSSFDVGPLQVPTGALWSGLTSHISDEWQGAFSPGINSQQIAQIRESLAQQGFNEQAGPVTGMLNNTMRNLTQLSPSIGMDPNVQQMVTDNTRYAQASLSQLTQTMGKDLVTAANSANVSFTQMASDMQAYGEWSQQNGGTAFSGQQLAQTVARSSGLPADTFLPMMSSPMTQAMAMTHGGVPPWAMGALPTGQQFGLAMQGFNLAAGTVKGMDGATSTIPGTSIKEHTPATAVQAATMNQLYYGGQMKNSVLQQMLKNPNMAKGMQEATSGEDAFRTVSQRIGNLDRAGGADPTSAVHGKYENAMGRVDQLKSLTRTERDPTTGKLIFSKDERNSLFKDWNVGATAEKLGVDPSNFGVPDSSAQRASDLLNKYKDMQGKDIGKNKDAATAAAAGGPQIGLTPQASKFFQIVSQNMNMSPQDVAKIAASAGSGSTVNQPYGTGPTSVAPAHP